jgi:hypothetical protein
MVAVIETTKAAVKERPIISGAESVNAILEGRKTQTRRVVKWRPLHEGLNLSASSLSVGHYMTNAPESGWVLYSRDGRGTWNQRTEREFCPYGKPGERLWVREGGKLDTDAGRIFIYAAEPGLCRVKDRGEDEDYHPAAHAYKPRTARYMPRWASRITLEITAVRVERVRDITVGGCKAEGISASGASRALRHGALNLADNYFQKFREGWDELNAKRGFGWDSNPWVWVVEFRKLSPDD